MSLRGWLAKILTPDKGTRNRSNQTHIPAKDFDNVSANRQGINVSPIPISQLISMAKEGDPGSVAQLGCCFWKGGEVPVDYDKAQELLSQSAATGFVPGIYLLGCFLEDVRSDDVNALKNFEAAAEEGHDYAQKSTADLYIAGRGVPHNYERAVYWYHRAAENNVTEAQFILGEFHRNGFHGVKKDTDRSIYWYQQSARNGYEPAQKRIEQYFPDEAFRNPPSQSVPANQIEDLPATDRKILELPEDVVRSAELGFDYYSGKNGGRKDFRKAFPLLLFAAQGGHTAAQYSIALMYFQGEGTGKDLNESIHWLTEASKGGSGEAQHQLSTFLYHGVGCKQDIEKAAYWCRQAAYNGVLDAMFTFGGMLRNGVGVSKDPQMGMEYVKMAAMLGSDHAQRELRQQGIQY
jgi:TPR repeat protein